ncbi:MAG: AAA family ATPase [Muribaculaceae bacterium]|jgi:uncharacterized protein|nr:AAA family ATPase [Muribaculaceae bacterium]
MFERTILRKLDNWANDSHRKPLILRGARQVGKTTVVRQFGDKFDNYLYLNLEKDDEKKLFEMNLSLDELLTRAFMLNNKIKKKGRTLLFIDEIQNSPKAVSCLRYFYEDKPEIYVIAAGSLLESMIDYHISFPVGRVQYLPVRPCSFREFVNATGNGIYLAALDFPERTISFHDKLIQLFNTYTLIGGMPEVVQIYAENHDILSLSASYESLLQSYHDDVEKYSKGKTQTEVIRHILHDGWAKAGEAITLSGFADSNYKSRETSEAFSTLGKAMLLELVYPTTSTEVPPISDLKRSPKLIWLDCGIVNYAAKVQKEILGAMDILDAWRGKIAEQVVAQELLTLSDRMSDRRNFWVRSKDGAKAEVDFVYVHNSHLLPIEVKSGHNSHLRSLHSFIDRSPYDVAIRVWSQSLSIQKVTTPIGKKEFTLINLPFYLVGELPIVIDNMEELGKKLAEESGL